jgi:hypothetical protein
MDLRELGKYYGYPDCCIRAFLTKQHLKNTFGEHGKNTFGDHGFIPCAKCAAKIQRGETTLENLIQNRECETPFPEDDGQRVVYRRLRNRLKMILQTKLRTIKHPSSSP